MVEQDFPAPNKIQEENQLQLETNILEEIDEKLEETNELKKLINIP